MCVKHATQVLSSSMARFLIHHSCLYGPIDIVFGPLQMPREEGMQAAKSVQFLNDLFDSVHGHTLKPEAEYRVAVTKKSGHREFWARAVRQLRRMRFLEPTD